MIEIAAPALAPAEAAFRLARHDLPAWWVSPAADEVSIARHFVAADPIDVVEGDDRDALARAWDAARARWGAGAPAGVPIGVGYCSYDLGEDWQDIGVGTRTPSGWPRLHFRFFDALWERRDDGTARILAASETAAAALQANLAGGPGDLDGARPAAVVPPWSPVETRSGFLAGVARVQEYLRAGDVYQVNLARRLSGSLALSDPTLGVGLADRLLRLAPAPYGIFLPGADGSFLLGNSPECFLRRSPDGAVETRPIKGTRARQSADDAEAVRDLLASDKDRAEHVMIVDLERNDLGRVCEIGSVTVTERARPIALPTVHHLVSTVAGRLRRGVGLTELLAATFPGGSITGAPKRRAMQIIAELEGAQRGPYTGATGWLGAAGDLELAVAIRTAAARDGNIVLWVGGGIVADSDPESEWRETEAKAAAFVQLVGSNTGAGGRA